MPADKVEAAWRACEAAWRRPQPDYETLGAHTHPDAEMFTVQSLVEGGGYVGAAGFREWLNSWNEMFVVCRPRTSARIAVRLVRARSLVPDFRSTAI